MSEIVKTLLKDVGIDFDTEEPKHNTGNVAFLKEEVPKTRSSGKRSFMSFRRADEEEIKLAHEERHQKELAKIAQESSLLRTIE